MSFHRHAVRRLNPFRGVSRIVEGAESRAVSTDGVNWELQLLGERTAGWGSLNAGRTEARFYRYGVWSAGEGLARFPGNRAAGRKDADAIAERLVEAVAEPGTDGTKLSDCCECWLLDAESRQPLALLAAAEGPEKIPPRLGSRWRAAPGDDDSLAGLGRERAAALDQLVARRGGGSAWFLRDGEGGGKEVGAATTATLPREAFPELLLGGAWPASQAGLVAAYFDWLAPRLLMLPLATPTRARLETAAASHPDEVARFFHLFPAVADPVLINTLRVQARLTASLA